MSDRATTDQTAVVITTSILALITGFLLGLHTARGYIFPPELFEQRRQIINDPVETSDEDVSEDESTLDHAPNWANGLEADKRDGLRSPRALGPAEDTNEECKMVLVVRTDLGMTKGKIGAQCGHATLACYKKISRQARRNPIKASYLRRWEKDGQVKIAVKIDSELGLMTMLNLAGEAGLTAEIIVDAGRTQIDPGSLTVVGIGPGPKSLVDKVTGELKLL